MVTFLLILVVIQPPLIGAAITSGVAFFLLTRQIL